MSGYANHLRAAIVVAVCYGGGATAVPAANLGESSAEEGPIAMLEGIRVNKLLAGCITVQLGDYQKHSNITVVKATVDVLQSISACGCKSAVLEYRVLTPVFDPNTPGKMQAELFRVNGRFGALKSREVLLVTSADNTVQAAYDNVLIEFGCAPPD